MMRVYQGIDPMKAPVPVQPTAHYAMGGIPTDCDGRVLRSAPADGTAAEIVRGLFAAGECACVSVHGANRLGTNSLVDLLVFGRRSGRALAKFCAETELVEIPPLPGKTRSASFPACGKAAARNGSARCARKCSAA